MQRAEIRMTRFPIVLSSPLSAPVRSTKLDFCARLCVVRAPFAADSFRPAKNRASSQPIPGDLPSFPRRSIDRSLPISRRESCQWKMEFFLFFFFSRQKNSIRDTGIFIRVSNSFFFFFFSRVAASVSQSNRVILVVTEFLSSLPFAG